MTAKQPIISIRRLTKSLGGSEILKDLDLDVYNGEFLTLLGPSGCGKTTLLRIIAGLESPDSGDIFIDDERVNDLAPELRQVNMIFQQYALFPHMNVFNNVAFGLRCKKRPESEIRDKVQEALKIVRLQNMETRKPNQLSGGQSQRVAIARAIVNEPLVLLLDEPFSALDYHLRRSMQLELKQLQRKLGLTFIFVTHDQKEALSLSDRVVVMNEGRIAQVGTPTDLYENPKNRFVAGFIGEANIFKVNASPINDALLQVKLEGQNLEVRNRLKLTKPSSVYLMIRPEDIDVWGKEDLSEAEKAKALPGVVEQVIYNGSTVDLIVTLASGVKIAATEFFNDETDNLDYHIAEKVWINWIPGWELVLPCEDDGSCL